MAELEDARAEAAALREAVATADAKFDALKKQQAEAKAKAKAIILRQKAEANQRVEMLEKEKGRQAEELKMVKDMLREEAEVKKSLQERVEELDMMVETGKRDLERVVAEKGVVEERVRKVEDEVKGATESGRKERETLEKRVGELEEELKSEREEKAKAHGDELLANGELSGPADSSELDAAKDQIAQLDAACERLRNENQDLLQKVTSEGPTATLATADGVLDGEPDGEDEPEMTEQLPEAGDRIQIERQEFEELMAERSTVRQELQEQNAELSRLQAIFSALESNARAAKAVPSAGDDISKLSKQLDDAREELKSAQETHGKAIDEMRTQKNEIEEKLASADQSVTKFKSDLEKSEVALQQERENVLREKQKASEVGTNGDDSKKILEAKVGELERVIASKQADIVKVRDKARTYLKDINAEKREMEDRMNREVQTLREELAEEQQKVQEAEDRAEGASSELDNCLALIREKQKSLQMLKMTITTEKRAAEEARRETYTLRTEFVGYKKRAHIALNQKESAAGASEAAIDTATTSLRAEVDKIRKDNLLLRKHIASLKHSDLEMKELLERAEKAEAAVDLLRKDATGVSTANYSQIDILEEKIASLEGEVTSARASAEDAEARQETTMMRLEAAERALRGAEVRAEEARRLANKTIDALKKQVESLESALERAEQSSAAAQRTAAAAAKALAFTTPREEEATISPTRNVGRSPQRRDGRTSADFSPYGSPATLNGGRSSLAVAMEGHADSLGLGVRSDVFHMDGNRKASDADLQARDKQITVLTTQVAELGALLDDAQQETNLKSEQTALLKTEVKNLDAKLAAAEKLQNGAPFSYLRTIVVRYLETDDATLLPVVANVLSFTKQEEARVKARRGSTASASNLSTNSQKSGYFSLPFLGSR